MRCTEREKSWPLLGPDISYAHALTDSPETERLPQTANRRRRHKMNENETKSTDKYRHSLMTIVQFHLQSARILSYTDQPIRLTSRCFNINFCQWETKHRRTQGGAPPPLFPERELKTSGGVKFSWRVVCIGLSVCTLIVTYLRR